ncbi:MAG: hypothetical protein ABIF11_05275, partial [Nitrospirota bacterium]
WLNGYKGNWEITISLNCPAKDVGHAKFIKGEYGTTPFYSPLKKGVRGLFFLPGQKVTPR